MIASATRIISCVTRMITCVIVLLLVLLAWFLVLLAWSPVLLSWLPVLLACLFAVLASLSVLLAWLPVLNAWLSASVELAGFKSRANAFFIGLSCFIPTIVFYYFYISFLSVYRLVLWGWGLRTAWYGVYHSLPALHADLFYNIPWLSHQGGVVVSSQITHTHNHQDTRLSSYTWYLSLDFQ